MKYILRLNVLALLVLLMTGCQSGNEFADLQAYMDEQRARPKGQIQPLPKFTAYEAFTYSAAGMRSPFQPPVAVAVDDTLAPPESTVRPDPARVKQFLESFDVASFSMVGSMSNEGGVWALLKGGDGVHRVKVGDYLGRNHGRITSIDENEIKLVEIVPSGKDVWVERPRTIELREG
ncbi:pilus assembly protein PilP [Aestuariirhabdus sp. Z084]|uniref:pilus assembly protein PilP n=1 Tax=Aestuariirhabdus haliotis TaxID=2918751 RepID=UPI00201B378C|nr:pilus assembly protein PilP [Aestuariirhabdus haliotis]MCL6414952.1 pilus assembly protein PilP [Aestuariirhabdus haliotis]MCL6418884.1 pilus assembly protein PilP [Aestuariirhabdus haliotis]